MRKKLLVSTMALVLVAGSITASAASKSLFYKDTEAKAVLDVDFHWAILDSDDATAYTDKSTGSYPVAVRLELWKNKSGYDQYKYDSDPSYAECNFSYSDVYCYQSRHSIDNSKHTVEYAVKALTEEE
ncbi:hypothetical protein [[Clostridium] polysaccharolyticum]|uniref:Uncharacterized protein n=1 Tax=[Clostridium] polysaccharolyticum TaxID=29364 RepID=A0A1H9ZWR8_9FIRM|nr:hypothetical protein [[Clostridium] polysaccharolyticum]SES86216.1 hypothetical protein SAMN04487772_104146 [[Clostridium] polysaccharolyticum]